MGESTRTATIETDRILDLSKAVTELEDGDLLIEGYAADWLPDHVGDTIEPGAFAKSIKTFLTGNPALLYHHNSSMQLGKVVELEERSDGLWMKALVAKPEPNTEAADIFGKIKRGIIKGLSVRGKASETRTPAGPRVTEVDLLEISLTPLPVNPRTLATVVSKAFPAEERELTDDEEAELRAHMDREIQKVADRLDEVAGRVPSSVTASD